MNERICPECPGLKSKTLEEHADHLASHQIQLEILALYFKTGEMLIPTKEVGLEELRRMYPAASD